MQMRLSISLIAAALFTALAFGTTRADTFTYSLNAPTGYGGGTLTGTVAFVGNSGDPVPDLGASPNFSFNFTPSAGPSESWTQADPVGVSYIASLDFGGGLLGDPTLTAQTIPSGLNYWAVTNGGGVTLDLYWAASPYGPNWEVKNNLGAFDYVYGTWSLTLQSDVSAVPLPTTASTALVCLALLAVVRLTAFVRFRHD